MSRNRNSGAAERLADLGRNHVRLIPDRERREPEHPQAADDQIVAPPP
jgi:hypothetical protein